MTPAEKLAKEKSWKRSPRNKADFPGKVQWPDNGLREIRESLRLSLREVAKAVGLSINSYWCIEKGRDLVMTNAVKIAAFYGKPVTEIWRKS